jgi:hypothetical protein
MDQNDLFTFFMSLRRQHSEDEIPRILEMYEITKLDVNRIYRYLDKYIEKTNLQNDYAAKISYSEHQDIYDSTVGGGGGGGEYAFE